MKIEVVVKRVRIWRANWQRVWHAAIHQTVRSLATRAPHWFVIYFVMASISSVGKSFQGGADETKTNLDLKRIQEEILQQLPKVGPTVVSIEAGGGSGSGVIVSPEGLVLTAAHVIDKAKDLTIIYPDGRRFRGKALGTYGPGDAGMAQILEGGPHPFVDVAPADSLILGQTAFAMGHPGGFDLDRGSPIRIGHITEIANNFISLDAPLIGGDSGGPSFDLQGRVIGIHSHINDRVDVNRDGHISAFHRAWDSMKRGLHDAEHYSKSVKSQSDNAGSSPSGPKGDSLRVSGTSSEARDRASRLQELVEKTKANEGKLKIDREELLKLRKQLTDQTDSLSPTSGGRIQDSWAAGWHAAFEPHCRRYKASVVKVINNGRQTALATIVSTQGLVITKASEVKNRQIQLQVATIDRSITDNLLPTKLVAIDEALDLALLKVEPSEALQPLDWSVCNHTAPKGSLCAAIGVDSSPVGFGIISVSERSLDGKSGAFLGIGVEPQEAGLKIIEIKTRSPALQAGLRVGDILVAAEANTLTSADQLSKIVASMLPGDPLRLDVHRDQTQLTITVKLADGTQLAPMPGNREQAIDSLTAKLSKRRWGFRLGLQHDCSIASNDCGGPLIDLDGKLIGINIARAGRIQSFSIPIHEVQQFVERSINPGDAR